MTYTISPSMGEPYTVTALIVITLGGFGSMAGALVGGLALGVIEAIGMHFTSPSLKTLLSYGIFIAVLLWRPNGLFTRDDAARPRWSLAVLAGAALALPFVASEFVVSLALTCLMYVALASSWALFCGTTRYLSLATSAFFGIGAYTARADARRACRGRRRSASARRSPPPSRWSWARPVLHLRGTYFAVLTFGMTELIRHAITYFEKQVTGTVGRVLTVVPERDTVYFTVLGARGRCGASPRSSSGAAASAWRWPASAPTSSARRRSASTRGCVKIAGFALTAAFAGAVGAAMSVRWTYIDPATVFNPFIGFQTVLIALIGGAATLWGPLLAAVVFSLLAETLRLQVPQLYMMALGLLLILCVLYLPGGLASLRWRRPWRAGPSQRSSRRAKATGSR